MRGEGGREAGRQRKEIEEGEGAGKGEGGRKREGGRRVAGKLSIKVGVC